MIEKLFNKAYLHKAMRKHDFLYIAIDMHGTVFNYFNRSSTSNISGEAVLALRLLTEQSDVIMVGFTSSYQSDIKEMRGLLKHQGVKFSYFNENPECRDTETGDFSKKFYYDILLDDRAGFDPLIHWQEIIDYYTKEK